MGCWTDWCSKAGNKRSPFCRDWNKNVNDKVLAAVSDVESHRQRRLKNTESSSAFRPENRLVEAEEDQRALKAKRRTQAVDESYYYNNNSEREGKAAIIDRVDGGTAHNVSD